MFIKRLTVSNFKSFQGKAEPLELNIPNGEIGSGLNIFIGENNTGKSTIFETIDFIRNGTKKSVEDIKNKENQSDEAVVEITFQGEIEQIIDNFSQPNKVSIFKKYITNHSGEQQIHFMRHTSNVKTIKLWSGENKEYKNESGIDAPVKKLFETYFVWADTNPNDQTSFGATTICGNLLKEIATNFTKTCEYESFSKKFQQVFNDDDSGLRKELIVIEKKTQAIFREQFGDASISFHFDELDISTFFKNTTIELDDGINTPMNEKGSGMQRSLALALLQVYAEELTRHPESNDITKPFFLFIDEPEICLHPKAQKKLLNTLLELSKHKQIFLASHSPYFLITEHLNKIGLFVFKNSTLNVPHITNVREGLKLFPWSPTWGEVNFIAYNLPTTDFHNELYGRLQELSKMKNISGFEDWLVSQSLQKTYKWTKEKDGEEYRPMRVTLQTFIRHKIHHLENKTMRGLSYTLEELKKSILEMIAIIKSMPYGT
jgi:predicted ATP-dependent endonuclease of OLD family